MNAGSQRCHLRAIYDVCRRVAHRIWQGEFSLPTYSVRTPAVPPGASPAPTASEVYLTAIMISWVVGNDGGSAITGFTVRPSGGDEANEVSPTPGSVCLPYFFFHLAMRGTVSECLLHTRGTQKRVRKVAVLGRGRGTGSTPAVRDKRRCSAVPTIFFICLYVRTVSNVRSSPDPRSLPPPLAPSPPAHYHQHYTNSTATAPPPRLNPTTTRTRPLLC